MSEDVRQMSLEFPTNVRGTFLSEYGLKWIADKHNKTFFSAEEHKEKTDTSESNLVSSLLEQLRQKDIQLAEKDKQIALLMEQAKNYQVLLQGEQMLALQAPKKSFFKRLFFRSSDE